MVLSPIFPSMHKTRWLSTIHAPSMHYQGLLNYYELVSWLALRFEFVEFFHSFEESIGGRLWGREPYIHWIQRSVAMFMKLWREREV